MQHIAAYKFIDIAADDLPQIKQDLLDTCLSLHLKGSILLGTEGINLYVAGDTKDLHAFQAYLQANTLFRDLEYKISDCTHEPYTRMLVKIKNEIITFHDDSIKPTKETAPHLAPQTFKEWYDSNKPMLVLDTRNRYEVKFGTFKDAVDLNIESFNDFADACEQLPPPSETAEQAIVTFCTGGIRCEKAAALLMRQGYKEVYQLDGGILNYFAECGDAHYDGECFVFDKRIALDGELKETSTEQCRLCRNPMPGEQLQADEKPICDHCR